MGASADEQALVESTKAYLSGPQSNALRRNGYVFCLQTADGTVISNSSEIRLEDLAEAAPSWSQASPSCSMPTRPRGLCEWPVRP